jgi:speckle-type POZ protein
MATRKIVTTKKWRIDRLDLRWVKGVNPRPTFSKIFSLNGKLDTRFSMKIQDGGYGWNILWLICNDLGQNQTLELKVKSWYEDSDRKAESETRKNLVFNKSGDAKVLQGRSKSRMLNFATCGTLFFCCEIRYKQPINEEPMNEIAERDPEDIKQEMVYRNKIGQTTLELLSGGHSDMVIQIRVGEKEFKANKFVLMAHSDTFQRMLTCQNSTEAQTGIINIEDVEPEVIEALIRWIYHAEIPNMNEVAAGLYRAADKYGIGFLKEQCMKVMIKNFSIEHLPARLILSYTYNEEQLKSQLLYFIREDSKKVQSFMASDEWSEFSRNDRDMRKKILADIFESLY